MGMTCLWDLIIGEKRILHVSIVKLKNTREYVLVGKSPGFVGSRHL